VPPSQASWVDTEMGADWQKLAVIHILVGYEADLLGLAGFGHGGYGGYYGDGRGHGRGRTTEGLLIAAFIFYTFVAVIVALMKFAELKLPEKIISIVNIVLLILAGQNVIQPRCTAVSVCGYGQHRRDLVLKLATRNNIVQVL